MQIETKQLIKRFTLAWRLPLILGLLATAGLLAAGCSQGSYPLDIFYEMHYQPSYRVHEPPRLSPPASAMPWYGSTPPQPTSFAGSGRHIFEVNCVMCHGPSGQGDGPVLARMAVDYGYITTDAPLLNPILTSEAATSLGRDELRGVLTGGVNIMPNFSKLLTEDQIELVLDYVQGCIQQGDQSACD
jgi:mono/diheme cytochrome c family protein